MLGAFWDKVTDFSSDFSTGSSMWCSSSKKNSLDDGDNDDHK